MPIRRNRRGFERAGALSLDRLGLPRARARELILAQAWDQVAGPALAARVRAARVQRGVLEIEVTSGRWSATLREWLPRLAGRLSRAFPELGVRKFRVLRAGSDELEPAQPVAAGEQPLNPEDARPAPEATEEPIEVEDSRSPDERLEELASRYLQRGADQNQ